MENVAVRSMAGDGPRALVADPAERAAAELEFAAVPGLERAFRDAARFRVETVGDEMGDRRGSGASGF